MTDISMGSMNNKQEVFKMRNPKECMARTLVCLLTFLVLVSSLTGCFGSMTPVNEPASGTVLSGYAPDDGSKITVKLADTGSSVVMLKDASDRVLLSFFVRAGESATVDVPAEKMYVHFASGKTWYGEEKLFGKETVYRRDKELTDFTKYSWEYELDPMSVGEFVNEDSGAESEKPKDTQQDYAEDLGGSWIDIRLKDGSSTLNVSALAFTRTVYNCTGMTVNMNVQMNANTHCKDWTLWGRNGSKFVKIGKIYLPDGDGYVSQPVTFASPVTFDAIAVTPTVPGGYSWSMGLSITDVRTQ